MKNLKKIIAIVMAALVLVSTFAVTSFAAISNPSTKDRYSVLVLDVSGSMDGDPIEELKKGAVAFCEQVLSSTISDNKIAIVTFETNVKLLSDFTDDKDALIEAIEGIYTGDMTNLAGGLSKAKELLEGVEGDVIKDIVVMCDGLPNQPSWETGESAAYSVVESLPFYINIYGLYFCPNGFNPDCERVMQTVGRNGYEKVEDGSALVFEFVGSGNTINNKNSNYVVLHIACPVDVAVTLNGVTLDKNNTKTTFGTLEFAGENDEEKIVTLTYRDDYLIEITGTGTGTMDYSATYFINEDELFSLTYPTVAITPETKINTGVDVNDQSKALEVDADGDGTADQSIIPNNAVSDPEPEPEPEPTIWEKIMMFFNDLISKFEEIFGGFLC